MYVIESTVCWTGKVHVMHLRGLDVYLHSFIIFILGGGVWWVSCSRCFDLFTVNHCYQLNSSLVGPRVSLFILEKRCYIIIQRVSTCFSPQEIRFYNWWKRFWSQIISAFQVIYIGFQRYSHGFTYVIGSCQIIFTTL